MMAAKARKSVKRKPVRKVTRAAKRASASVRAAAKRRAAAKKASVARRIAAAARLSKAFHGRTARKVTRARKAPTVVGMVLGRLEAVEYRVPDGTRYRHEFRGSSQPTLAATHDGRRVFVQGGRYRMTRRGIVDKRK